MNVMFTEMSEVIRALEPHLTLDQVVLRLGFEDDIVHQSDWCDNKKQPLQMVEIALTDVSASLKPCPSCTTPLNYQVNTIVDTDLQHAAGAYAYYQKFADYDHIADIEAHAEDLEVESKDPRLAKVLSIALAWDEAMAESVNGIEAQLDRADPKYVDILRPLHDAALDHLVVIHAVIFKDTHALLRKLAVESFGITADDTKVYAALYPSYSTSAFTSAFQYQLAATILLSISPFGRVSKHVIRIPRWLHDLFVEVSSVHIGSKPYEDLDDRLLETAVGLWSESAADPYSDFDTCIEAAKKVLVG